MVEFDVAVDEQAILILHNEKIHFFRLSHLSLKIPSFFAPADVLNLPAKSFRNVPDYSLHFLHL